MQRCGFTLIEIVVALMIRSGLDAEEFERLNDLIGGDADVHGAPAPAAATIAAASATTPEAS